MLVGEKLHPCYKQLYSVWGGNIDPFVQSETPVRRDQAMLPGGIHTFPVHLIGEGMVPWNGLLSFRQYLPNKPDKFGMKLYILCDSTTGYLSLFDVYTGADYEPNPERDEFEDLEGHTFQVVMGLMRRASVLGKGYNYAVCRQLLHKPHIVRRIICGRHNGSRNSEAE